MGLVEICQSFSQKNQEQYLGILELESLINKYDPEILSGSAEWVIKYRNRETKDRISLVDSFIHYKDTDNQREGIEKLEEELRKRLPELLDPKHKWLRRFRQGNEINLALRVIKKWESFESQAYPDPETGGEPWTIGYGTTVYANGKKVRPGDRITEGDAVEELKHYVTKRIVPQLEKIPGYGELRDYQKAALISFAYNVGEFFYGAEGFETISKVLRERNYKAVPTALRLYVNPGGPTEAGLRNRREEEIALWQGA